MARLEKALAAIQKTAENNAAKRTRWEQLAEQARAARETAEGKLRSAIIEEDESAINAAHARIEIENAKEREYAAAAAARYDINEDEGADMDRQLAAAYLEDIESQCVKLRKLVTEAAALATAIDDSNSKFNEAAFNRWAHTHRGENSFQIAIKAWNPVTIKYFENIIFEVDRGLNDARELAGKK